MASVLLPDLQVLCMSDTSMLPLALCWNSWPLGGEEGKEGRRGKRRKGKNEGR